MSKSRPSPEELLDRAISALREAPVPEAGLGEALTSTRAALARAGQERSLAPVRKPAWSPRRLLEGVATVRTKKRRLLWVCCALLVLAAGAWGVQKVVRRFMVGERVWEERTITLPDGSGKSFAVRIGTSVVSDDPNYTQEKAEQHYQEAVDLVRQGKAELTVKDWGHGRKLYKYTVVLSDGEKMNLGGLWPLDSEMTYEQRLKEWADLVAQGKIELVEVEELEDGKKKYWYRLIFSDGIPHIFSEDGPLTVAE